MELFEYLFLNQEYHSILQGNLVHVRRADMQSIDVFLHVPDILFDYGQVRGLAMFFNPTLESRKEYINLPLYYTGLEQHAVVYRNGDKINPEVYELNRDYSIDFGIGKSMLMLV